MTLFEIGTQLEGIRVQLERVDNLLSIYDEDIEHELEQMGGDNCWGRYIRKRYDRFRSLMEVIQLQQEKAIAALSVPIDAVYAMSREAKASQTQK